MRGGLVQVVADGQADALAVGDAANFELNRVSVLAGCGRRAAHEAALGIPLEAFRQVVGALDTRLHRHDRVGRLRRALRHADLVHERLAGHGEHGVGAGQAAFEARHPRRVFLTAVGVVLDGPDSGEAAQLQRYRVVVAGLERIELALLAEPDDVAVGGDDDVDVLAQQTAAGSDVHVAVERLRRQRGSVRPLHRDAVGSRSLGQRACVLGEVVAEIAAEPRALYRERHIQKLLADYIGAGCVDVELKERENMAEGELSRRARLGRADLPVALEFAGCGRVVLSQRQGARQRRRIVVCGGIVGIVGIEGRFAVLQIACKGGAVGFVLALVVEADIARPLVAVDADLVVGQPVDSDLARSILGGIDGGS